MGRERIRGRGREEKGKQQRRGRREGGEKGRRKGTEGRVWGRANPKITGSPKTKIKKIATEPKPLNAKQYHLVH